MKVPNKGCKDARIVVGNKPSKDYAENYDRIFGKREEGPVVEPLRVEKRPSWILEWINRWF